ncbi:sigma-70 family RNA polymerase sigma factor [Gemmata sp. G18]|uniref:Sigma-70 family RNA polymerase sigma factor n=1 Tax=Gemmata palustris TaxID=2822762 RepID=A0ABS5C0K7_9BACT|nr:sigma-70 family RNA polymerase sigma factor [Gemmata palustris]MBP3959501.1 sigma-70 family RNA polymerase sigma factor [Gemmata palustris]
MTAPTIRDYLNVLGSATARADDADLVARFAATRDQAAFELLVWRHAALVYRVCRAVLRDHHAAEDAAQATFLVLARKAESFGGRGSVVGWLYRASRRVSVRLARQRARRPVGGAVLDTWPAPAPAAADDTAGALCAEIDRLPEGYRVPILLCFFEGLTHAEAAHRTGWPVGTVAGRLARAKTLLAHRLSRRGVGLVAIALPVASAAFVGSTARAATAFAAGTPAPGLVTPTVLSLARGASTTMTTPLLKLSAAAVAVLCAVTAGVWGFAPPATPALVPAPPGAPGGALGGAAGPVPVKDTKPVVRDADAQQRARSSNNLKQIMIAVHGYHDQNGCLPRDITDNGGKRLLSWRVHLLPYLEQEALYKQFKLDEPWDSENNQKLLAQMPAVFRTGTDPKNGTKTYYQGFVGPGTVFEPGERITIAEITDGTSNTVGVIEAGPAAEWTKPGGIAYDPKQPFPKLVGPFSNVRMVALMDGATVAFKPDLKDGAFRKFVERADGELVDHDGARADVKPAAKEDQPPGGDLLKQNAELVDRMHALQAERQALLAEVAKNAKRAETSVEALTRENEVLKAEIEELKRQVEQLRKLTPKK